MREQFGGVDFLLLSCVAWIELRWSCLAAVPFLLSPLASAAVSLEDEGSFLLCFCSKIKLKFKLETVPFVLFAFSALSQVMSSSFDSLVLSMRHL